MSAEDKGYKIIRRETNLVHEWAGGKTAEILLLPEGSDYAKKDFEVRISAAETTVDKSVFSDFSGYTRLISPTKGVMKLEHVGHHRSVLKPFQVDKFSGGLKTNSEGSYTDFNLLFDVNWDGMMRPADGLSILRGMDPEEGFYGFFAAKEGVLIQELHTLSSINERKPLIELNKGDFVYTTSEDSGLLLRGPDGNSRMKKIGFLVKVQRMKAKVTK